MNNVVLPWHSLESRGFIYHFRELTFPKQVLPKKWKTSKRRIFFLNLKIYVFVLKCLVDLRRRFKMSSVLVANETKAEKEVADCA